MIDFLINLFHKKTVRRIFILIVIGIILYLLRSLNNLFLLTFLLSYIIYHLQNLICRYVGKVMPVSKIIVSVIIYSLLFAGIVYFFYRYLPSLVKQATNLVKQIMDFYQSPYKDQLQGYIGSVGKYFNVSGYIKNGADMLIKVLGDIGKWGANIFVAFILSMFFVFDVDSVKKFLRKFEQSKIKVLYFDFKYIAKKFLNSFGKVFQAQIIISFINCLLSLIILWILGFPDVVGLSIMIFLLGLIPVAGVIISLLPLSLIAYSIGGFIKVIYILIMVAFLHILESYILNPKLMSQKTKLPVLLVLLILIISKQIMGIWGLIIGIPIFIFLLDLLNVYNADDEE